MADISVTASFNSGEWAPNLFARVDIQKYRSAAALLENFFVDYRGGASTRTGTAYTIQTRYQTNTRIITFQAAFNIGYVLELGDHYVRFIFQGNPVLENPFSITAATKANPCVLTIPGHNFVVTDWIFVNSIGGMTQLNDRYYIVSNVAGNDVTLAGLNGFNIDSTTYTLYTTGGTAQRIYTIASPWAAADLDLLKFAQDPDEMIICHPSYAPYGLKLISALSWSLLPIAFGSSAAAPSSGLTVSTTLPVANIFTVPVTIGTCRYSYGVTTVDSNGQESSMSVPINLANPGHVDIRSYGGSNQVNWNAVNGASYYNVYEAEIDYFGVQPPGVFYGFVGYTTGTSFIDSNIGPDFSQGPPVSKNPFVGEGISFIAVTVAGTYTTVPNVSFTGGTPTIAASAHAVLSAISVPTVTAGGTGFLVGDTINFGNSLVLTVLTLSGSAIATWAISNPGAIASGSVPSNPIAQTSTSGSGTGATATVTWGVGQVIVDSQGSGYGSVPTVVFSAGAAAATATLSPTGNGNPGVVGFFQQRLVLAQQAAAPATFHMSRPGQYFNFDIHNPIQADDAITGTLVSNQTNHIQSIVSVPAGMLVFTDQAAWVVNGGFVSQGVASAVSPTTIVAAAQSFIGSSDVPPIIANFDVLYVESKGSKVRDLTYNIYFNVFSGEDISVLSSQLFYGFTIEQWAWAEQPFYEVWAVRNDGVMLTLTFLKEQQFSGWSHHVTAGSFRSVTKVTEPTSSAGVVDAVYTIVQRSINGTTVKYIERFAERTFPNGVQDAWCVDSGLEYIGPAILSFSGAEHLSASTVTGLATDNLGNTTVITPFSMPTSGFFTLPAPASPATGYTKVIIGLGFTAKLQTMPLDITQVQSQGKVKKIPHVDVRVTDTLGLQIGSSFGNLVPMKDLIQGNVSSMRTGLQLQQVNGLYTGDARTYLDPTYTVYGQYCIQQSLPYPATILGVFPSFVIGDDV